MRIYNNKFKMQVTSIVRSKIRNARIGSSAAGLWTLRGLFHLLRRMNLQEDLTAGKKAIEFTRSQLYKSCTNIFIQGMI